MNTLFTERTAIEMAFRSLEAEKEARRAELREDLNKIDDRQYYILERLREMPDPEPTMADRIKAAQNQARQIEAEQIQAIQAEPITTGTIQAEPIELREKAIQGPLASVPAKPNPTPRKAKGKGSPQALIEHDKGVKLLTEILKEAGKPVNAKYIEKEILAKTGVQYTNVYDPIRAWVKHSNGKLQKIGAEYSIK